MDQFNSSEMTCYYITCKKQLVKGVTTSSEVEWTGALLKTWHLEHQRHCILNGLGIHN